MLNIASIAVRAVQIVCAAVVLGILSALVSDRYADTRPPGVFQYVAVTGAFGIFTGYIGLAAIWVEGLQTLIMAAVDILPALLYLAGGISVLVKLSGISYRSMDKYNLREAGNNPLLN